MSNQARLLNDKPTKIYPIVEEFISQATLYNGNLIATSSAVTDSTIKKLERTYEDLSQPLAKIAQEHGFMALRFKPEILTDIQTMVTKLCLCALYDPDTYQEADLSHLKDIAADWLKRSYRTVDEMIDINPQVPSEVPLGIQGVESDKDKEVFVDNENHRDAVYILLDAPTCDIVRATERPESTMCGYRPSNCPAPKTRETKERITLKGALARSDDEECSFRLSYFNNNKLERIPVKCSIDALFEEVRQAYTTRQVVELELVIFEKIGRRGKVQKIPTKILGCKVVPGESTNQYLSSQQDLDLGS